MQAPRTIVLVAPKLDNLAKDQRRFLDAVVVHLHASKLQIATAVPTSDGLPARIEAIRDSDGVIVVAFEQWEAHRLSRQPEKTVVLPSEFAHIDCALALAACRPLLVLRERSLASRGALRTGYLTSIVDMPRSLDIEWLDSANFLTEFNAWIGRLAEQKDVFLGYSTQAADVGERLADFLIQKVGVRVFDWHAFRAGESIWDSIARAERTTKCGVFLFMQDDAVRVKVGEELAPRDNVVYEAGYFAGAKGLAKTLIVREQTAKIPSDLGGILYLQLPNRRDSKSIERPLRESIKRMLGGSGA